MAFIVDLLHLRLATPLLQGFFFKGIELLKTFGPQGRIHPHSVYQLIDMSASYPSF
jgi:hypothetical protein